MINLSVPMPEGAFSALRLDLAGLAWEMGAAAIQWYAQGRINQDKVAIRPMGPIVRIGRIGSAVLILQMESMGNSHARQRRMACESRRQTAE